MKGYRERIMNQYENTLNFTKPHSLNIIAET